MTSEERKETRYQRRKASRQRRREERLKEYDDFDRVKDANNLITAFKKSKSGVDWKASVQRYEMNLLRNINNTVKALESGRECVARVYCFLVVRKRKTTDNTGTPDHVGVIVEVHESAGYFVVVEGNYSNAVKKRTLSINGRYIRGFISPKYDADGDTEPVQTSGKRR